MCNYSVGNVQLHVVLSITISECVPKVKLKVDESCLVEFEFCFLIFFKQYKFKDK